MKLECELDQNETEIGTRYRRFGGIQEGTWIGMISVLAMGAAGTIVQVFDILDLGWEIRLSSKIGNLFYFLTPNIFSSKEFQNS